MTDVEAARQELISHGADVSAVFHDAGGVFHHAGSEARVAGSAPDDANWPDWYARYMVAEQAGTPLPT